MRRANKVSTAVVIVFVAAAVAVAIAPAVGGEPPEGADLAAKPAPLDYFQTLYKDYRPGYLDFLAGTRKNGAAIGYHWGMATAVVPTSFEKAFTTFNQIEEHTQAYSEIEAARRCEARGDHRDAMKIYQQVIEKYPRVMYRVDQHGVFVPISLYCQLRILSLPPADLAFYRTLYDGRAKEAFDQAKRQYSLIGFQEIVDSMLATTYGADALLTLGNCAMDNGRFEEALERFSLLKQFFRQSGDAAKELDAKIAHCRNSIADGAAGNAQFIDENRAVSTADSAPQPDVKDPMAVSVPVWKETLPGSYKDFTVYTQPVVARDSVVYLHKNIVYSHSLLNGQLRWKFDIGGQLTRQIPGEQLLPLDELLVHEGMVYANVIKSGPSLVALDFISGQMKWIAGPTAPLTKQDTLIRYESAPVGGQRTVYAGYVLDNIEGDTHFDTVYGIKAFDSETGQELWNQQLCRLSPGKFSAGTAEERRIRIRSFSSPPVLHQGTLYYNTNAGAIAALDARSGEIKWVIRYPYWPTIHDATAKFQTAVLWSNQAPIVAGDSLCVAPVDSPMLFCIERNTGKVKWTYMKGVDYTGHAGHRYLRAASILGPTKAGELVVAYGARSAPLHVLDIKTGQTGWAPDDIIKPETRPAMTLSSPDLAPKLKHMETISVQLADFVLGARPMLTESGKLYVCSLDFFKYSSWRAPGYVSSMSTVSLPEKKIVNQRRFYDSVLQSMVNWLIYTQAAALVKEPEFEPYRANWTKIANDTVPGNDEPEFLPMVRLSLSRYGMPFELRMDARSVSMCYDRAAVLSVLEKRKDAPAIFARAEQALYDNEHLKAAALLKECTQAASAEDLDLRTRVNQLCYQVNLSMAQQAIRDGKAAEELAASLDLSRTAGDLAGEVQAMLALSEAYQRSNDTAAAVRCLRSIIRYYGNKPYASSVLAINNVETTIANASIAMDRTVAHLHSEFYVREFNRVAALQRSAIPSYAAAVSPLPRMLSVEAGPLAVRRLLAVLKADSQFAGKYEQTAAIELGAASEADLLRMVMEFPGTRAAQEVLDRLQKSPTAQAGNWSARKYLWSLSYVADVCGLTLNDKSREMLSLPAASKLPGMLDTVTEKKVPFEDQEVFRMILERRDEGMPAHPELMFVGGRARKRLDNKFEVSCYDVRTGQKKWSTPPLRLKGTGQEPGFSEAFVYSDTVVVHGLYDVLAFNVLDGKPRWTYRAPFNFEILNACLAGNLLILAGSSQTVALFVPTDAPTGEVAWECQESGDLYIAPFVVKDRVILVRKNTDCVTARQVGTGRLIATLEVPGISRCDKHPLLDTGPATLPVAHAGNLLIVTDNSYYIAIDVMKMAVIWKRPIDNNDESREPPMRLSMNERCCVVLKKDFDAAAIYGINSATGALLWRNDVKVPGSPKPMHSIVVGEQVVGILPGAGRGFHVIGLDPLTGKQLYATEFSECQTEPVLALFPTFFGDHVVLRLQDNQKFSCVAINAKTGKRGASIAAEGVGPIGAIGKVSMAVQAGSPAIFSQTQNCLVIGTK
jgi:outer membrane protein assembly factor BamB